MLPKEKGQIFAMLALFRVYAEIFEHSNARASRPGNGAEDRESETLEELFLRSDFGMELVHILSTDLVSPAFQAMATNITAAG